MSQSDENENIYKELKQLFLSNDIDQVPDKLKNKLRNAAVSDRKIFEQSLLFLVQDEDLKLFRKIIYEILPLVDSLWSENLPKEDLITKFWIAYNEKKYEEAGQIFHELTRQGLDFLGNVSTGECTLLPLDIGEEHKILRFNEKELHILNPDLKIICKTEIPKNQRIIDVLPPVKYNTDRPNDINDRIWVLLEDVITNSRTVVSLTKDHEKIEFRNKIEMSGDAKKANRLSRFQNHLLLVSTDSIFYYQEKQGWGKWIRTVSEITCFEDAKVHYWVGLVDGHIRILQSIKNPGLRKPFERHPDCIKSLHSTNKFLAITSKHYLNVTDLETTPILRPIIIESQIIDAQIFQNEIILILQANGRLVGRDLHQGNILWEINLGATFDSILTIDDKIYCKQKTGRAISFQFYKTGSMIKCLEEQNINISAKPSERNLEAPILYYSEFIGRENIIEEIKKSRKSHFLIHGAPKTGKTSLLNVLGDVLSISSKSCYIDLKELLEVSDSYNHLEFNFIQRCLTQHNIPHKDLKHSSGYLALKETGEKIRGAKEFCVLCIDNFNISPKSDPDWDKKFMALFKELFVSLNIQLIITFSEKDKKRIMDFFSELSATLPANREKKYIPLPLFSEVEAKTAIRRTGALTQQQVEEIYHYSGGFPHLIPLFQNWNPEEKNIKSYIEEISKESWETIFAYFQELSPEAYILLITLFYKNQISRKVEIKRFYNDFPLMQQLIPGKNLKKTIKEIENYNKRFDVSCDDETFTINVEEAVTLFHKTSQHIPWIQILLVLYKFCSVPNWRNADEIAKTYGNFINISFEPHEDLEELISQHRDEFYIRQLTWEGQRDLGMPLATYFIIPLKPWAEGKSLRSFNSLHLSIQEFLRKSKTLIHEEKPATKFYITLFSFFGKNSEEIKKEMKGLERISVIGTGKMIDILLSPVPKQRSSEYIINQLNISERSPYTTAGAVQDLFFGRELEIALIRGLPENIGVFGTRTIGKTSLLLKLYREFKEQKNWRVYALDCALIESEALLLKNLAEKMEISFKEIPTIEKFRKYITKKAEDENIQYLFLLDEVDGLVDYDAEHEEKIFRTFNRICTEPLKAGGIAARFVLFGFQRIYEQMKNPKSRFYNFMVFLPLQPLDRQSALSLVTSPIREIHIKWQDEERDANYLVDQCSGHPLFLQAACHTLLTILDDKSEENKGIIERKDVNQVFHSNRFQELCMRYYNPTTRESIKSGGLLRIIKRSHEEEDPESFLKDIHKITILTAVINYAENKKESFTLSEIQKELKGYKINISPGHMREILNLLCLSGTFRLIEESTLITPKRNNIQASAQEEIDKIQNKNIAKYKKLIVDKPDVYNKKDETSLKFQYTFAIKIFPILLIANFDGIENCKDELNKLLKIGNWKKTLRRH